MSPRCVAGPPQPLHDRSSSAWTANTRANVALCTRFLAKSSWDLDTGTCELEGSSSARALQVPCCLSPAFASSAYLPGNVAMHTAVHFQPNGLVSQIKFRSCHTCTLRKGPRSAKAKMSRYGTGSSKPCCIFGEYPVASFAC